MVVVFGLSFELPLLLVMLNFAGIITGKRMLGWWRGMIMGITVFAAVATPSTDPLTMMRARRADRGPVLRARSASRCSTTARRRRASRRRDPTTTRRPSWTSRPEDVGEIEPVSARRRCPSRRRRTVTGSTVTTT